MFSFLNNIPKIAHDVISYIILSPAKGCALLDSRNAAMFGLDAIRCLKAFSFGVHSIFFHASGNCASVARRTWNKVRSAYVNVFPITNLNKRRT